MAEKREQKALDEPKTRGSVYKGAAVRSALPKPSYDLPKTNGKRTVKRALGK